MLDLVYVVVIQGKTSERVGCGGIRCLDSVSWIGFERKLQRLGELTVLDKTMALCSPDSAIASRTVRPTPPVPPAMATTTIV